MSEISNNSENLYKEERNHFLDSLKGICILFVIFCHYNWTSSQSRCMLFPFIVNMAVPIFMIISGYVYYLSFKKNNIISLEESWSLSFIIPKIIRYTIPFLMIMCVEFLCLIIFKQFTFSFFAVILQGGYGPGSYYYPVMIQFIFFYPIIYFLIKKYSFKGYAICLIINALYELFQRLYFLGDVCYRLLVFRYISVIAFGALLASEHKQDIKRFFYIIAFIIGTGFILLVSYLNYIPKIIIYWTGTSFLATLYVLPISAFLINNCRNIRCLFFERIGKASFNIFLVQMVYFSYISKSIESISNKIENWYLSVACQNLLNILICVCIGILFYNIESRITKKVLLYIKNKTLIKN